MTGPRRAPQPPRRYEIRISGHLSRPVLLAFPALHAETHGGDTFLRGELPDRSALYGVLARIEDLGLELLELRRL